MEAVTELHRKSLIRLMRGSLARQPRRRQRSRTYGPEVDDALRVIAESTDYICAERLTPNLRWLATHLAAAVGPTVTLKEEPTTALLAEGPSSARNPAQGTVLSAFATVDFSGPGTCALCPERFSDEAGAEVSLTIDWRSTMMANAAKESVWQAKVSSEVTRLPALQAVDVGVCDDAVLESPSVRGVCL